MRQALLATPLLLVLAACGGTTAHPAASGTGGPTGSPTSSASPSAAPTPFVPRAAHATTLRWHLPTPLARQALITTGPGHVVLAGGMRADDTSTDEADRIDLATGRATALPRLAVPVHDAAGGPYAGVPAVFGGGNATEQSLVQALRGGRWHQVDAFPTTRSDLSVVALPGETLALGGYDGSQVPRGLLVQRGSSRMVPRGSLAAGVRYAATAHVGRFVYVLGGEVAGQELATVQRVDVRTGRTRVVGHLPHPLGHAMAATFGGRVLLMGGRTSATAQTDAMWWFDPASGRFTHAGRLPRVLSDAAVAVDGHAAYLLGGEDPSVTDRVVRVGVR